MLLDFAVKAYFLPIMVCFFYFAEERLLSGFSWIHRWARGVLDGGGIATGGRGLGDVLYSGCLGGILAMDCALAAVGYAGSFWWLGNKTRSVDPTWSGWAVTLLCYPPFHLVLGSVLAFGNEGSGALLPPPWFQDGLRVMVLLFFSIYVWATMAFGLRFSNLTHRGIVTRGPYAWVRHPAYAAKVLAWVAVELGRPGNIPALIGLVGMAFVYYLRAVTEERHLRADPAYRAYCERVRYRFLPGVW